jgi:uncharacterized protein YjbJ (UPF0337 family)
VVGGICPRFGHGYLVMADNNQETLMKKDQVKDSVEEAKGKVKEAKGKVKKAKGKVKEAKGKVKETGDVMLDDKGNRRFPRTS